MNGDDRLTLSEINLHYSYVALDKSIRLKAAAEKKANRPIEVVAVDAPVRAVETMIVARYDANKGGLLSREEARRAAWPTAETTLFYCDANKDERVSVRELSDAFDDVYNQTARDRQTRPNKFAVWNWRKFNVNRDKWIERAEARRTPYDNVNNWFHGDFDGDDRLTLSELNAHYSFGELDKSRRLKAMRGAKTPTAKPNADADADAASAAGSYAAMLLARFDRNDDGAIDNDEARRAPWPKSQVVWRRADTNTDGCTTSLELQRQYNWLQKHLQETGQQSSHDHSRWLMRVVDRNNNGRIDEAETRLTSWPRAGNNWFKGDANNDRQVTYHELLVAMTMNAMDKGVRLEEAGKKAAIASTSAPFVDRVAEPIFQARL